MKILQWLPAFITNIKSRRIKFVLMNQTSSNNSFIRQLIIMFVFLLVLSFSFVNQAHDCIETGIKMKLNVNAADSRLASYKHYQLSNENYFITGLQGDLWWQPHTLIEAALLLTIKGEGVDPLVIFSLFILLVIYYFMFRATDEGAIFNSYFAGGFRIIIFIISTSGIFISMARSTLADEYIPYITHGKFSYYHSNSNNLYYYILGIMLLFLMRFPQKALQLQEQQALTI